MGALPESLPLLAGGPPGWVAFAVINAVGIAVSATIISHAISNANSEAEAAAAADTTTACSTCGDPCKQLNEDIKANTNELKRRYDDMREDKLDLYSIKDLPAPTDKQRARGTFTGTNRRFAGSGTWKGHQQQFKDKQKRSRDLLEEHWKNGCGPPPDGAWKWATIDAPPAPRIK